MDSIVLAKDFDISNVRLASLKNLENGGKIVYINYKNRPLVMQTPRGLRAPFGMQNYEGKRSMELSLGGNDGSNPSVAAFYQVLCQLDDYLLDQGIANGVDWFKWPRSKKVTVDVVDALFTRSVRVARDKTTREPTDKYPPTFKLTVPTVNDVFKCDAYDVSRNKVDLAEMGDLKGARVTAIAQCVGVWVAGGKFGCSWKVVQLRVEPVETITGYAFRDAEDDGADDESDIDEPDVKEPAKTKKNGDVAVETSDDEPGDDDVENVGDRSAALGDEFSTACSTVDTSPAAKRGGNKAA